MGSNQRSAELVPGRSARQRRLWSGAALAVALGVSGVVAFPTASFAGGIPYGGGHGHGHGHHGHGPPGRVIGICNPFHFHGHFHFEGHFGHNHFSFLGSSSGFHHGDQIVLTDDTDDSSQHGNAHSNTVVPFGVGYYHNGAAENHAGSPVWVQVTNPDISTGDQVHYGSNQNGSNEHTVPAFVTHGSASFLATSGGSYEVARPSRP